MGRSETERGRAGEAPGQGLVYSTGRSGLTTADPGLLEQCLRKGERVRVLLSFHGMEFLKKKRRRRGRKIFLLGRNRRSVVVAGA